MQLLVLFVISLIILYLIFRNLNLQSMQDDSQQSDAEYHLSENTEFNYRIAYISGRKLYEKQYDGEIVQIHSPYVQDLMDKSEQHTQRHGWKQDTSLDVRFAGNTGAKIESYKPAPECVSAQYLGSGKIIYFLSDVSFGGLFELEIDSRKESRIIHRQNFLYKDLCFDTENRLLLCSSHASDGSANIVLFDDGNNIERPITAGDTEDSAPSWVDESKDAVVFQSIGLARSPEGLMLGRGPASIQLLDLTSEKLESVMEDASTDYLQPSVNKSGDLLYVRRPYQARSSGMRAVLADTLFFPFRIFRAVFSFLNFFSLMYTRKPLSTDSGNPYQEDIKGVLLKGLRIDADKALKKETKISGVPSLVPSTWQLVRRSKAGIEEIIASNVLSYDIDGAQNIYYTNGCGVFLIEASGNSKLLFQDKLIESIFV